MDGNMEANSRQVDFQYENLPHIRLFKELIAVKNASPLDIGEDFDPQHDDEWHEWEKWTLIFLSGFAFYIGGKNEICNSKS